MMQRKLRTVKKSLVVLDDVLMLPGPDYINWLPFCRQKLKEYTKQYFQIKLNKLQFILNKNTFLNSHHYAINVSLISQICTGFHYLIDQFNGMKLGKLHNQILVFRVYFSKVKKWWTERQCRNMGVMLWLPILKDIEKVCIHNIMLSVKYDGILCAFFR
jgi:hypothetical protein